MSLAFSVCVFSQTAKVPVPDTPAEVVFWQPVNVFVAVPDNAVIETSRANCIAYLPYTNRFSVQFAIADAVFEQSLIVCKPKAFFRYYLLKSISDRSSRAAFAELVNRRSYVEVYRRPIRGYNRNKNL
jgi:hypothetical protein